MTFLPTSRRTLLSGLGASAGLAACSDLSAPLKPTAGELLVWAPDAYFAPALTAAFMLAAKLRMIRASSPAVADIIVVNNGRIDALRAANALAVLDPRRLSSVADLDPSFLRGRFAASPAFALPIGWQITGLGYRRSKVDDIPSSWNDIYASARYPGRTGFSQDPLMLIRAGARALGGSFNDISAGAADRVAVTVLSQRRSAATAVNRDAALALLRGDLDLVAANSAEVTAMQERDSDLGFVVPREGGLVTTEMVALGSQSRNATGAYALLDFLLQPATGTALARILHLVPVSVTANRQVIVADLTMAAYASSGRSPGNEDDRSVSTAQQAILMAAAARAVA